MVSADNTSRPVSIELLEPLRYPPAVRAETERAVLGRFLRDWRVPFPADAVFHTNGAGDLTDIQVGSDRAAQALPFGGDYVTFPQRNLLKLGAAFYLERLPDAALVYWTDFLDRQPNAAAANGLGLMFARQQRPQEARDWFEKAIAIDPRHAGARNNLGVLYGELKQWSEAIAAFEAGIRSVGPDETLYLNLARAHIQTGDRVQARRVLERLLKAKPDSAIARRGLSELQ